MYLEDKVLTAPEAIAIARCNKQQFYGWVKRGELPAIDTATPGNRPRYKILLSDLTDFLKSKARDQVKVRKVSQSRERTLSGRRPLSGSPSYAQSQ
jgi:hypothetical protein